jgi:hypothetical protein
MLKLERLYCTSRGFDLLASLGERDQLFTRNKIMIQHAFLVVSFTSSLKNIAHFFEPPFMTELTLLFFFHFSLSFGSMYMEKAC